MSTEPETIGKQDVRAVLRLLPGWESEENIEIAIMNSKPDVRQFLVSGKSKLLVRADARKTMVDLQSEIDVNKILISAGCQLLEPFLKSREGNHIFVTNAWKFHVRPFIESSPQFRWLERTWTSDHAYAAGKALFDLHKTSKQVMPKLQSALPEKQPVLSALSKFEYLLTNLKMSETLMKESSHNFHVIKSILTEKVFEPVLIHGDFHPGNVLFENSSVKAVIDFDSDYLFLGPAELDCAYGSLMFAVDWRGTKFPSVNREYLCSFLRGYSSTGDHMHPDTIYFDLACYLILFWANTQENSANPIPTTVAANARALLSELPKILH